METTNYTTMIKLINRRGKTCPLIFCVHCGKQIRQASDGIVIWGTGETVPLFVHRGVSCYGRFATRHYDMLEENTVSLDQWLETLISNLKLDVVAARRMNQVMSSL